MFLLCEGWDGSAVAIITGVLRAGAGIHYCLLLLPMTMLDGHLLYALTTRITHAFVAEAPADVTACRPSRLHDLGQPG